MRDNGQKPDAQEMILGLVSTIVALGIVIWLFTLHVDKLIPLWRGLRLVELTVLNSVFSLVNIDYFDHYLSQLSRTPASRINWTYVGAFESSLNFYMRFIYGSAIGYLAVRSYKRQQLVTRKYNVQTMIEAYAHINEALQTLAEDNPLKGNIRYDFSNRDDFHNRHAQALSPQQYLTAVPPVNATFNDLKTYAEAEANDNPHHYRPIAIIDRRKASCQFSHALAKTSLERQLTKIPSDNPYYLNENSPPRLFDEEGYVYPLEYDDDRIVGGFSRGGLLNGGREYLGVPEDIRWLFAISERKIFDMLCARYRNPRVPLYDVTTELLKRHAFTRTYLVALLNVVRKNELVASTEFYLVQREDRGLYFSLYSASEEKPFYEAMGVMAHYHMELLIKRRLTTPWVLTAVRCLERDAKRLANAKTTQQDVLRELTEELVKDEDVQSAINEREFDDNELVSQISAFAENLDTEKETVE